MRARATACTVVLLLALCHSTAAEDFRKALKPLCDSLCACMQERTSVHCDVKLEKVLRRGDFIDLYFSKELGDFPWKKDDVKWFERSLKKDFPAELSSAYKLGEVFVKGLALSEFATPALSFSGQPVRHSWKVTDPLRDKRFIEEIGARRWTKGLDRRYIALWQSHGRYYDEGEERWAWQRAPVMCTVEDLYTQSYVLPFLIPMLENAGASVFTPRERDTDIYEVVADNDPSFSGKREAPTRQSGRYSEKGGWSDAGQGFADAREEYAIGENPFEMGTARKVPCSGTSKASARAVWKAEFPKRGRRAVYISYKSLPNSTSGALYTVKHLGGQSKFIVNQKMGGGTWIYLGTFEFDGDGSVEIDNSLPPGRKAEKSAVITADGVRFGGGMGKIMRGGMISGLPAYTEGASYSSQWGGFGKDVYHGWDTEYTSDYAGRGVWVKDMKDKKNIPFDMSLGFHTDAGVTPDESTVGTLAIYTLKCDGKRKNSDGTDRIVSRILADYVQTQIVTDIRNEFNPQWSRRGLWDRSYSESRTSDVPAMLLELLSHQNFSDMVYGHDPKFRFTVCRAVYKGILKFLSGLYGCQYAVQPLPVHAFSVTFGEEGEARLSWSPTEDALEPTAGPTGYTVYTRIDGGAFDKGRTVNSTEVSIPIEKGHVYSFKVEAWNEGGKSFPSETLSISEAGGPGAKVLIVNGFTRTSGPESFDSPSFAGFNTIEDHGVPYIEDIHYIGDMYDFRRNSEWISNRESGFGATYATRATEKMAGNTFDYPYIHGSAMLPLGISFCSQSMEAFLDGEPVPGIKAADFIFGKQKNIFTEPLLERIQEMTGNGISILLSGSETGTSEHSDSTGLARKMLGFRWLTSHGTPDGSVGNYRIVNRPNPERYCVENPDGIRPAGAGAGTILKYSFESTPAAVRYDAGTYRVAAYGFPIEALQNDEDITKEIQSALNYLVL